LPQYAGLKAKQLVRCDLNNSTVIAEIAKWVALFRGNLACSLHHRRSGDRAAAI